MRPSVACRVPFPGEVYRVPLSGLGCIAESPKSLCIPWWWQKPGGAVFLYWEGTLWNINSDSGIEPGDFTAVLQGRPFAR
jgi:hypothetical protein